MSTELMMKHAEQLFPPSPGLLSQARVVELDPAGGVTLRSPDFGSASARNAVGGYRPRIGDDVLVGSDRSGNRFILGVLRALRPAEPPGDPTEGADRAEAGSLVLEDGTSASLEQSPEGPALRVRDTSGALLFEHRSGEGVSRLYPPQGSLEIHAPEGDLSLRAAGEVRIEGQRIQARAEVAEALLTEGAVVAERLSVAAKHLRQRVETFEQRAQKLLVVAKRRYEEIEDLSQTRSGRLKLLASATLDVIADHALLRGREDTKIQGEKIYIA